MTERPVDASRLSDIQQFLFREARLLDERDYEGWLALLAPDIHYWAPSRSNRAVSAFKGDRDIAKELSARHEPAIYDETHADLKLRIARVTTASKLWCENPPSRTRHLISNVEAYARQEVEGEFEVYSVFVVHQSRFDETGLSFFGSRKDILREVDNGQYLIARRDITLDLTVVPTGAVTIFF